MEEKKLLITGFEPFGGESVNPSWEAVKALPEMIGGWRLIRLCLPVEYGRAARLTEEAAVQCGAGAVLCVGQAGGREAVTPELVAVNLREASLPDNAGFWPQAEPVDPQGPAAYFSTLPVWEMTRAIREAGIPARLSLSAGSFVCNDLLYSLLQRLPAVPCAFIHVPYLTGQSKPEAPAMTAEQLVTALTAAIGAIG